MTRQAQAVISETNMKARAQAAKAEADAEHDRRGGFDRIIPSEDMNGYAKFAKVHRYADLVLQRLLVTNRTRPPPPPPHVEDGAAASEQTKGRAAKKKRRKKKEL